MEHTGSKMICCQNGTVTKEVCSVLRLPPEERKMNAEDEIVQLLVYSGCCNTFDDCGDYIERGEEKKWK